MGTGPRPPGPGWQEPGRTWHGPIATVPGHAWLGPVTGAVLGLKSPAHGPSPARHVPGLGWHGPVVLGTTWHACQPGTAHKGLGRAVPCQWEMKKWTGSSVILALAFLLLLRYALFPLSTTATTTAAAVAAASSPRRSHPPPPPPPPFSPKPCLLPSLLGLDVLFPSPNSTCSPQLDPSSKLACANMRPLLLYSDALPGTADGIQEAAAA